MHAGAHWVQPRRVPPCKSHRRSSDPFLNHMSQTCAAPTDWKGILRQLGPGLIISAAIVGSGELILTTKLGAEVGFSLLWFIIFGCMIKVLLQVELGRQAIVNGRTTLESLNRIPGPRYRVSWLVWIWVIMFVCTFFQVAGMVGGIAQVLREGGIGKGLNEAWWVALVCLSVLVLLVFGKYVFVERASTAMVAFFTLLTVLAVFALNWTPYSITAAQLADGFRFRLPDKFATAFAAFGIIGVGASELIYYPYWCLEKGYARRTGPNDGSDEWIARAAGWMRILRIDAWTSMVVYTLATVAFYLLGAAVLHAKHLVVEDANMVSNLSHIYRESFGLLGFWLFLAGAFSVLYSTVFIATASNGRLVADFLRLAGLMKVETDAARDRIVRISCVSLPVLYFLMFLTFGSPVSLVTVGAVAQALMLPLLGMAGLWFLYTQTDSRLRPGRVWQGFLWVSALLMALTGSYQLVMKVKAVILLWL